MARPIVVQFLGDTTSLDKAFNRVGVGAGAVESHTSRIGGALKGLATAGAAFGAINFFKGAVSGASDLNESLSKTRVVFGDSSVAVEKFASSSAKSLGVSRQAALEAAGTFGNLFIALGVGQKPASGMSTALVKLAGDLASFNNVNPEDALLALRSGLVGEVEPLRKFGVSLSAARIEAEAMSLGLAANAVNGAKVAQANQRLTDATRKYAVAVKEHGAQSSEAAKAATARDLAEQALTKTMEGSRVELNAAQKAQAAYSIILKDTKTAQGDFERTSNGLANRQRILKAEFADLQAQLGTKLLPVVNGLGGAVITLTSNFGGLAPPLQVAIGAVGALTAAVVAFAVVQKLTAEGTVLWRAGQLAAAAASGVWTAAQWALNAALDANPIGLVVLAVAALAAGIIYAYHHSETFRNVVQTAFGAAAAAAGVVVGAVQTVGSWFAALPSVVGAALDWVIGKVKDLARTLDKALGPVDEIVGKVGKVVGGPVGVGKRLLGFADGGVVPGPKGSPTLAVVHGGETVVPPGGGLVSSGDSTFNVNVTINTTGGVSVEDGNRIVDAIVRASKRGTKIPSSAVA